MNDTGRQDWTRQWQALTRQYWNAWQDLSREAGAAPEPAARPWHEGFEQWSRMFAAPGAQSETVERLLASAKSFTAFAQSMIQAAGAPGGAAGWADALRNGWRAPGLGAFSGNPLAEALREISGQGAKSFEQMMEGVSGKLDPTGELKRWLNVPAFGFLREHQERYQKMAASLVDYQEQTNRYNALILKVSARGFELFESKLAAHEEPGRQIDSLRALYDLWVDAAEEAYQEIALSQEFREVYGALVNAQMRVRAEVQQEVERVATDFGMPTRTEIDSIGRRLHELRRELRGGAGSGALAREVEALRREVATLKVAVAKTERPAAPAESRPSVPAAKPAARKSKKRTSRKSARADKAVALKAQAPGAVRTLDAPPAAKPRASVRGKSRSRPAARKDASARRGNKKSSAKIAHRPSRSAPVASSFAERLAAFAHTSHRPAARKTAQPDGKGARRAGNEER